MNLHSLRPVLLSLILTVMGIAARAETVLIGWSPVPSLYEDTGIDRPSGFFGDLAGRIAEEAGLDIAFIRYDTMWDVIDAQARGEVEMLGGVGRLPALRNTNVFSDPVARSAHYLFVRAEDRATFDLATGPAKRIGVVESRRMKFTARDQLAGHRIVPYESGPDGLHGLLAGLVDALVVIGDPFFHNLRIKRIDHRVAPFADPLQTFDRLVALHTSRADLMPVINRAVARMEASGELNMLRQQWGLMPAPVPPSILTVGVTHFPPYQVHTKDGSLTGFSVEVLRDIGRRAGLSLRFIPITSEEFATGPRPDAYDMLPQSGITLERRRRMDFALPTSESTFAAFVRKGDSIRPAAFDDLAGERVGVVDVNLARGPLEAAGTSEVVTFPDTGALLEALVTGEIRVAVNVARTLRIYAKDHGLEDFVAEVEPPLFSAQRAPALRFGLGEVRERLNAVIPGYLASDDYRDLQMEWFGDQPFLSGRRLGQIGALVAVALLFLGIYAAVERRSRLVHQRQAAQKQLLADAETAHAREATALVAQLEAVNEDLARSNGELDAFAYVASHDLKAPLIAIDQTSRWIEEDLEAVLTEESRETFQLLRGRVSRMSMLLNDLLEHARIGRNQTEARPVTGRQLAGEVAELAAIPEGFTLDLDPSLDGVVVNAMPLLTVLLNLVRNAVKHAERSDGTIRLSARETGGFCLFCVEDDGPGIDPKNHERIFGMFQTLRSRDEVEGSGMGLAIVQKTVTLAGGRITLDSSPGCGCRFTVAWPALPGQADPAEKKVA